jgi:hypothetical protein
VQGKTYYWKIVSKNDCNTVGISSAIWYFNTFCMRTIGQGYTNWVNAGKPDCWCYQFQRLGDVDGKEQGSGVTAKRVGSVDFTLFTPVYGKKRSQLVGSDICSDLDHLDQGSGVTAKAVGSVDFGIISTNYGKKTSQLNSAPYAGDYYYWTIAP